MSDFEEGLGYPNPDGYQPKNVTSHRIEVDPVTDDVVIPDELKPQIAVQTGCLIVGEVHSWSDVRPEQ